jgi:hypothetical protein
VRWIETILHVGKIRFAHKIAIEKAQRNKPDRIAGIDLIQTAKLRSYEGDYKPLGSTITENFFTS